MEVGNFLDNRASELVDKLIGQFIELPPKGGHKETSTTTTSTTTRTTTTEYNYEDYDPLDYERGDMHFVLIHRKNRETLIFVYFSVIIAKFSQISEK